jgi:hypothetical protein
MEIAAVPFESVIRVAELAGSKTAETHVVLGVGRGQREDSRSRKLEDRPFEGEQALRMQVFDHLDHSRSIEARQTAISIRQRTLQEFQARSLGFRHALKPQAFLGPCKRRHGGVDAYELLEEWVRK